MALDGLRFAFGTLTVLPVRVRRWDRASAARGMACAPLVGLVVGAAAAGVGGGLLALGAGPLLAAVACVAVPAALTRGLHLDGLADVADGLGSGKPPGDALRIMKQSDVGPFGVLTLVLVLLAQVAALAEQFGHSTARGVLAALLAGVTGRAALTLAARSGVPAARPEGLGAAVAGAVPRGWAYGVAAVAAAVCAVLWFLSGAPAGPGAAAVGLVAASAGLVAAEGLLRRCRRRFGGVTGDVFGALCETAATTALVCLALA